MIGRDDNNSLTENTIPIGGLIYLEGSTLRIADAAKAAHFKAVIGIALKSIPAGSVLEQRVDGCYLDGERVIAKCAIMQQERML